MTAKKAPSRQRRPRPTDNGVLQLICNGLIAGNSIRKVCEPVTMPSCTDVYVEMARNEDFRNAIARARIAQQDVIVDEIVDMADAASSDDWQVVKLRIWARQWRAAKLAPKRYGDSPETGDEDEAPVPIKVVIERRSARKADALPE